MSGIIGRLLGAPKGTIHCLCVPVTEKYFFFYPIADKEAQPLCVEKAKAQYAQAPPRSLEKAKKWLPVGVAQAQQMMKELEEAPMGSFKHRTFQAMDALRIRIDPDEDFLRSLFVKPEHMVFFHPPSLSPDLDIQLTLKWLGQRSFHRNWGATNAALLPLTLSSGMLPGPNVLFYWNAYRTWCHYAAHKGSAHLNELVASRPPPFSFVSIPKMECQFSDPDDLHHNLAEIDLEADDPNFTLGPYPETSPEIHTLISPEFRLRFRQALHRLRSHPHRIIHVE